MSILDRINTLIRANINDLVHRADEPERVLDGSIRDMEASLKEARARLNQAARNEASLAHQWDRGREEALDWEDRAMTALRAGDESMARECLVMKKRVDARNARIKEELEQQRAYLADLSRSLDALQVKLDSVRSRRDSFSSHIRARPGAGQEPRATGNYTFNFDSDGPAPPPQSERRPEAPRAEGSRPGMAPAEDTFSRGRRAFLFDEDMRREHPEEVFDAARPFSVFEDMAERIGLDTARTSAAAELGGYQDPLEAERSALEERFRHLASEREMSDLRRRAAEEPAPPAPRATGGDPAPPRASDTRQGGGLSDLRRRLAEELDG